jgi:hypothetical protein
MYHLDVKRFCASVMLMALAFSQASAQQNKDYSGISRQQTDEFLESDRLKPFSRLDVSLTAGSPGVGIDVAMPVLDNFMQVRAGFAAVPRVEMDMHFTVQVGAKPYATEEEREGTFERMAGYLKTFTGYEVDDDVVMIKKPTYYNGKLILDFFPFRNKKWYVSAGVFYGPSSIAEAYNTTQEMPSLVAVGIYNKFYEQIARSEVITNEDYFLEKSLGEMLGSIDLLKTLGFDIDPDDPTLSTTYLDPAIADMIAPKVRDAFTRIANKGRMGIRLGTFTHDICDADGNVIHKTGEPYFMEPDTYSGMVRAWVKVNRWKPYLGFGYGGPLSKREKYWRLSCDCGVMFWGGTPEIPTHDGIDLARDVENLWGRVGTNVRFIKFFKAFPVIDLRLTRSFSLHKQKHEKEVHSQILRRY